MESARPALEVVGLSKRFGTIQALDGVDLAVFPGEVHALVGENGAGKSTLVGILVGALQADAGRILVGGRETRFRNAREAAASGIAAVFQELSVVDSLSVAENVFANRQPVNRFHFIRSGELQRMAEDILRSFHIAIAPDTLVGSLSVAERQVVEILKCLAASPCVLLLDEPTSSLTQREKEELFALIRQLRAQKHGIVYISHHLPEVLELADRVTVLRDGKRVATKMRAEVTEPDLVRLMVGRELQDIYGERRGVERSGVPRLKVEKLARSNAFSNLSFEIWPGEIVGMAGLVGAGRTEAGLALFGARPADEGRVWLDGQLFSPGSPDDAVRSGVAYVTEDRKKLGLFLLQSIRDNLAAPRFDRFSSSFSFVQDRRIDRYAEACRSSCRIVTPDVAQTVNRLSGGNQQKVLMGSWIGIQPRLLIADEPTRGVDIGARLEIYAQLRELTSRGAGVLLISSDLQEILGLSDRILVMRAGRIVAALARAEATEENVIAAALGAATNDRARNGKQAGFSHVT